MRKRIALTIVLGSIAAAAIVVVVSLQFIFTQLKPTPYERIPGASYRQQITQTLAVFDEKSRSRFDALYPHEAKKFRDAVWNTCSSISPRGRVVGWPSHPETPIYVGVPIRGVSKADPNLHVTCTFDLDASDTSGWWDIFPLVVSTPTASPSTSTP